MTSVRVALQWIFVCAEKNKSAVCDDGIINRAITILGIIHRPVFYLNRNSIFKVCPYLTGNIKSPLRVQQINAIYRFVTIVY
jgi:hypothetical protein